MRRILLIAFLLISISEVFGQFGVRLSVQKNNYSNWNQIIQSGVDPVNTSLFDLSYDVTADYWFRLKNHRLEFYPLVGVGYSKSNNPSSSNELFPLSYEMRRMHVGLATHIYIFDFVNDCDCPTFSKQSGAFQRGFFILAGVKGNYQQKKTSFSNSQRSNSDISMNLEAGIGYDIGISDLLTITPFTTLSFTPNSNWDGLSMDHGIINVLPPDESTSNLAFNVGLRIGFRPDYLKNR